MTETSTNVLALALKNNELLKLLVGEPFYFFETKTDNNEPQNVIAVFDLLFMPCFRTNGEALSVLLPHALMDMLETYPDRHRAIYMTESWIWCYHYYLAKRQAHPDGAYAALPDIDFTELAFALKKQLEVNKPELMADKRWAGEAWNSDHGLWEPLMRSALHVRDTLGGPDYMPTDTACVLPEALNLP